MSTAGTGLQHAKAWTLALTRCKCPGVTWAVKTTGCCIREHAHAKTSTVYIGVERLAELTGMPQGTVSERRKVLVNNGWLVDTGNRKRRATIYQLVIPNCGCSSVTKKQSKPVAPRTGPVMGEVPF